MIFTIFDMVHSTFSVLFYHERRKFSSTNKIYILEKSCRIQFSHKFTFELIAQMLKNQQIIGTFFVVLFVLAAVIISTTEGQYGCYEKYCWSWCNVKGTESWCYTTKGRKLDMDFVRCKSKSDCDENWQCADGCRILRKRG